MKVLVIGGGGREHAIIWKLSQSPLVKELICAPGNAGIARLAKCFGDIGATDIDGIINLCGNEAVDFAVVGPDDPLSLGLVDRLEEAGIPAFGPTRDAAKIEYSKKFSKDFMRKHGIPTAAYRTFTKHEQAEAINYIKSQNTYPAVIKVDGLALGKGVVIPQNEAEAVSEIKSILSDAKFGAAGDEIVIEDYMTGIEATLLCFVDGKTIKPMLSSQDHKRVYDYDEGPNTGGMGAFAPSVAFTDDVMRRVERDILMPTMAAFDKEGIIYKGVLYVGLMLTAEGPKVIEYNSRFGDPETQAILPMLDGDLMEIFIAVREGRLADVEFSFKEGASCCVVMASGGYPGDIKKGIPISGIQDAEKTGAVVFHAATKENGLTIETSGGRVLGVTAMGASLDEAIGRAYEAALYISFDNAHYRRDIGKVR